MPRKPGFGTVEMMRSGRYRARYYGPDGKRYKAPTAFDTKVGARDWLAVRRSEIIRQTWQSPDTPPAQSVTLTEYAEDWFAHRDLKARTRDHYRKLLVSWTAAILKLDFPFIVRLLSHPVGDFCRYRGLACYPCFPPSSTRVILKAPETSRFRQIVSGDLCRLEESAVGAAVDGFTAPPGDHARVPGLPTCRSPCRGYCWSSCLPGVHPYSTLPRCSLASN